VASAWFPAWYLIEHPATRIDEGRYRALPRRPAGEGVSGDDYCWPLEPGGHGAPLISARVQLRRIDARLFRY